jgi:hypothetical protein
MSPESVDANVDLLIYHKFRCAMLNLTCIPTTTDIDADLPPQSLLPSPSAAAPDADASPESEAGDSEGGETAVSNGNGCGGFASFMHATLCIARFLSIILSGVLVV